jgi:hypothetical protein
MEKLSPVHVHEHHNLHPSNVGTNEPCSAALCHSEYEPSVAHEALAASTHNDLWGPEITTVMIRRIPRRYTQKMLVAEVANRGFDGFFDFLYLPWERKQGTNMGYAFMNFVDAKGAMAFREAFDGLHLNKDMEMRNRPLCVHPAAVQGYQANHWHFMRTKIGQKQDSSYSPIFLDHHSMEQKQLVPPPAGMNKLKKPMAEHWQYHEDSGSYHQANVVQTQCLANGAAFGESAPVQQQSTAAMNLPRHAKKPRSRQKKAAAATVSFPWSGADYGNSQQSNGNSPTDLDGMHAASDIGCLCLACGKPCVMSGYPSAMAATNNSRYRKTRALFGATGH